MKKTISPFYFLFLCILTKLSSGNAKREKPMIKAKLQEQIPVKLSSNQACLMERGLITESMVISISGIL